MFERVQLADPMSSLASQTASAYHPAEGVTVAETAQMEVMNSTAVSAACFLNNACSHTPTHTHHILTTPTHAHKHTHTHAYVHAHIHIHIRAHAYTHTCTNACMHARTHAHTHTHTHTHICTLTNAHHPPTH